MSKGVLVDNYFQEVDEYKIYKKGDKYLLTIIPKEQLDSTFTIKLQSLINTLILLKRKKIVINKEIIVLQAG